MMAKGFESTRVWFVTGTDTGVGKTVLTAWLVRHLRTRGIRVHAVKPLASGGRSDARIIRRALGNSASLDAINPWHFRAPLTPLLAARRARARVDRDDVIRFIEGARAGADVLIVEGAGGLLSPLAEDFDARNLMRAFDAVPIVVGANRLGLLNQMRLTIEALGSNLAARARLVVMPWPGPSLVRRTNLSLLREWFGHGRVTELPWVAGTQPDRTALTTLMRRRLDIVLRLPASGESR